MSNILALLLAAALLVTFPAQADESPYNKGVAAWRLKDYAEARKQWEASLAQGGPDEALNNLAYLLYYGLGGQREPEKAVELWRKGAVLAVSEAQLHLGEAYKEGDGITASPTLAYAWHLCAIATAGKLAASDETEADILKSATESLDKLLPKLTASERTEGERLGKELIVKYGAPLSLEQP